MIGMGAMVLAFMITLIAVNIKKVKESEISVLLRIMTNYLQVMTATMSYSMKFPSRLTNMFTPIERLGSSSGSLVSFDCFNRNTELKFFTPSFPFLKAFLTAILPLILIMGAIIIFSILYKLLPNKFKDFNKNIIISSITLIFFLHPTLTYTAFEMFQCIGVTKDNISKVKIDTNIDCYSMEHLKWLLCISVPMIIVWVLGSPSLVIYIIYRNRKRLEDPDFQKYFILLYQGLKNDKFYWEIINTLIKVLVVTINILMSMFPSVYKGATAILILIFISRVQMRLRPYKRSVNNEIELLAYTCK